MFLKLFFFPAVDVVAVTMPRIIVQNPHNCSTLEFLGQNLIICPVVLPDVVDAAIIALRNALDAVAAAVHVSSFGSV